MKTFFLTLALWCVALTAQAASLVWDQPSTGTLTIEHSTAETGPWTVVARDVPAVPKTWAIPGNLWGWFKISNASGISNVVRFSLNVNSLELQQLQAADSALNVRVTAEARDVDALQAEVAALLARLAALENPPEPTANLAVRPIDADRIELTGRNCLRLETTGSGLNRIVRCVH